ncbi:unnamed protein product [Caretta caretta]
MAKFWNSWSPTAYATSWNEPGPRCWIHPSRRTAETTTNRVGDIKALSLKLCAEIFYPCQLQEEQHIHT